MKNPFKHRSVTPALLFLQFALVLGFGILSIVKGELAFSVLQWVAAFSIAIGGISRSWGQFADKKNVHGIITLLLFLGTAAAMLLYPLFVASSAGRLFGIWFLINGLARATICIQCIVEKLRGKVRYGIAAVLSLVFGLLLVVQPHLQLGTVFLLAGIYLIIYSLTILVDAFSEILLYGTAGAKLKTRVRISLPLFLTALLPGKLLDDFNQYFKLNPKEAEKSLRRPDIVPTEKTPLEVFIHLSDKGTQRTGHVDIRYLDKVYSYGCYDHHAHKFWGLVSDGTMVVCESLKYIEYCIRAEEKILVGFGLSLTKEQCSAVERELKKITDDLIPWQSDYEKKLANMDNPDAASRLVHETGAKIYKLQKGAFRKYYTLNTNCVKLVDQIIGSSGLDLISINGIAIPGSYYAMLNDLYEKGNSIVTERNIYKYIEKPKKRIRKDRENHAKTGNDIPKKH